jgi:hypothetical protein
MGPREQALVLTSGYQAMKKLEMSLTTQYEDYLATSKKYDNESWMRGYFEGKADAFKTAAKWAHDRATLLA